MEPDNVVVENMVVKELLLPPRELPNKPRRLRDLSAVYPVDEQSMLLEAVGKYLREAAPPVTAHPPPTLSPPLTPSPTPPAVAAHATVASDDGILDLRRIEGNEADAVESPGRSPRRDGEVSSSEVTSSTSSPLSAAGDSESAYYADDSDTSRQLSDRAALRGDVADLEACTDDDVIDSVDSNLCTSCSSSAGDDDSAPGGAGELPWRQAPRVIRGGASSREQQTLINSIHQDGDDHNYSLASRSPEDEGNLTRNRRWTRNVKGGNGGGGGGEAKSITWRMRKTRIQPF